ncbi:MAG: hypothetical protein M3258_02015, partial [Thermoproteota archaeon]|nr:hypothetical protein [Thermoproteota archaeon]
MSNSIPNNGMLLPTSSPAFQTSAFQHYHDYMFHYLQNRRQKRSADYFNKHVLKLYRNGKNSGHEPT